MYGYHIGVIGGRFAGEKDCNIAYNVDNYLAENNCAVFCGGKEGIMVGGFVEDSIEGLEGLDQMILNHLKIPLYLSKYAVKQT